jgi:tol-pal system protein YbgF
MSNILTVPAALLALAGLLLQAGDLRAGPRLADPLRHVTAQGEPGLLHRAQSADAAARINQLDEQVRSLNGRVEELTFQLLQMQEEIRRIQEDNEFRFQELEGRRGAADGGARHAERPPAAADATGGMAPRQGGSLADAIGNGRPLESEDELEIDEDPGGSSQKALGPQALGSLVLDSEGNVIDSQIDKPIDLTRRRGGQPGETQAGGAGFAEGELPATADELYDLGYNYIQAGDYASAENAFGQFAVQFPGDPRIPEARFWLGESLNAQGEYEAAARVFLDAHKQYPDSRMGAQTLLNLGVALAGMEQRELACATFAEVPTKYPHLSNSMRENLTRQQNKISC